MFITSMILFPSPHFEEMPEHYGLSYEDVFLQAGAEAKIHGWYLRSPQEKAAILFLHGNAGNISHRLPKAAGWIERGYSVFLIDYRGYGKSRGEVRSDTDLYEDAKAGLQWLKEVRGIGSSNIILYGESIGSYPAIRLAGEETCKALILEAPFTSFSEMGKIHYGWIPDWIMKPVLKKFRFDNEDQMASVKTPLFIMHGTSDEVCPFWMGERLFSKAPGSKRFLRIEGGTHNDLYYAAGKVYFDGPLEFMESNGGVS